MVRARSNGVGLALAGALVLAPDSMFMRLSGYDGASLIAWRGLLMAAVLLSAWAMFSRNRRTDLRYLLTKAGLATSLFYALNAAAFSLGIALAPVALVLFGVAAVPLFAALYSHIFLHESVSRRTYVTMVIVLAAIGYSALDDILALRIGPQIFGALAGLVVANMLAINFVLFRANPNLPIMPCIGLGALGSGTAGAFVAGHTLWTTGQFWPIVIAGGVILPASFYLLSSASRHVHAAVVSLFMLLETALGPLFVWAVLDEPVTDRTILSGAVLIAALGGYLVLDYASTRKPSRRAA